MSVQPAGDSVKTVRGTDCFWAVLPDAHSFRSPAAIAFQFERYVPFAIDSLQLAHIKIDGDQLLVVGIPKALLTSLRSANDSPRPWRIFPDAAPGKPPLVDIPKAALARLNFLHGDFEPLPLISYRRILVSLFLLVSFITSIVLIFQSVSLSNATHKSVTSLRNQQVALVEAVVPESSDIGLPPLARLLQEYRLVKPSESSELAVDAFAVLDGLWKIWPSNAALMLQDVHVGEGQVTVSVTLDDLDTLSTFLPALSSFSSGTSFWKLAPVSLPSRNTKATPTLIFVWHRTDGLENHE